MSDELEDLKRLMDAATPAPNAQRRAENLELARKSFADAQGSRPGARPTVMRALKARLTEGTKVMLNLLSTRGALTATTAIAAVAIFMIIPQTRDVVLSPTSTGESQFSQPGTVAGQRATMPSDADEMDLPEPVLEFPVIVEEARAPLAKRLAEPQAGLASGIVASEPNVPASADGDTRNLRFFPEQDTEAFANAETNPLKVTADEPVSTFSIDVDTASYPIVRSSLMDGYMPPRDAVRVEELVNYFPYSYPAPEGAAPFRPSITVMPTPWNAGTRLVHIGLQGALPMIEDRPALNLVFLVDTSGSMHDADKLPLLKQSLRLMLSELRPEDQVSIVTYAGSAGQVLEPTAGSERAKILHALDRLEAGGSTAGQEGLHQAYQVAESMAANGEVTRVILATDGDFNVGLSDPEELKDYIADKRDSGTYLSVLGFGRGNLDDATMQALAQNGNGQAAYIDTLGEARKVLVDQLTGALFPIANDVKIQVEFNPAKIAEYRLIGYETRALRREDFTNDAVDAGDVGAGHSVTAIYEVTLVGTDAIRNAPLRYGSESPAAGSSELGYLKLRYKAPGDSRSQLIEQPIFAGQGVADDDVLFSAAIAGFGQLLRGDAYLAGWTYEDAIALGTASRATDPFGYRAEAVTLMRLAQSLSR